MLLPQNTSEKDFLKIKLALYRSMLTTLKGHHLIMGLCATAIYADNPYSLKLEGLSELWNQKPPNKAPSWQKHPYWWSVLDKAVRVRALRKAILLVRWKLFVGGLVGF